MRFALRSFRRDPDPDHIIVSHAEASYRVVVRRRATARRFTLRVSNATGEVAMSVPERADMGLARHFAQAHAGWIATRVAKLPGRVIFSAGATVPVRGVPHRIVHWSSVSGATRLTVDSEGAPILAVSGQAAHLPRRVLDFLKKEARRDLERCVMAHCAALGVPARKITIRDTTSRWGSCSARGHLNFSWRLILAPPMVLDYLAAHEVAHLKEMNHSHRFWALTHRLFPQTEEAERWLKRNGTSLHRFG